MHEVKLTIQQSNLNESKDKEAILSV